MRVPDVIPTCTAYLCVVTETGEIRFGGTAFYVACRFDSAPAEGGAGYLVTAKHNVIFAQERYDALFARVNTADGGSSLIRLGNGWTFPDSESSDVAVLPGNPQDAINTAELYPVTNTMWATTDVVERLDVGIGDDVVVTGLFTEHAGRERNIPFVRQGIISAMPTEPLQDRRSGLDYYGYLVELRSFGGLSGSPVFVRLDPLRNYEGVPAGTRYLLLGMVRGHWEYGGPVTFPADESRAVNMGIGIVTPVDDLQDLLYGDVDLVKRRSEMERSWLSTRATETANRHPRIAR